MDIVTQVVTFLAVTQLSGNTAVDASCSPTNGLIFLSPFAVLPRVLVAYGWEL